MKKSYDRDKISFSAVFASFFFTTTISMQQKFEIYNLKACVHFCTFVYIQTFTAVEDPYKKNGGSDSIFIEP